MLLRIAVSDPLPIYERGLMATLGEAGFVPEAPKDLLAWILQEQRQVVLLTLQVPNDWRLLADLRQARSDLVVVAVLPDASVHAYVRALLSGAAAAVPRDAPPETVRLVFKEALDGRSVLPFEVVRALAARDQVQETHDGTESGLPPREVEWLRELAAGATVAQLAERAGYSERAMFRLLRDLYQRIGAKSRTEALMRAQELGWLA